MDQNSEEDNLYGMEYMYNFLLLFQCSTCLEFQFGLCLLLAFRIDMHLLGDL
jgi:hypothetical protein